MTIEHRMARLERSAWWWRAGCLCAIALAVGIGAAGAMQDEIRTKRLVIINDAGEPAASLASAPEGGGMLNLFGPRSSLAITMLAGSESSSLQLQTSDKANAVILRSKIGNGAGDGAGFALQQSGKVFWQAAAAAGMGTAWINGPAGNRIWSAP